MPSGKKLRSIGRQMCPQDHLISVRGQKILRWNLGRTFLYTILLYNLFYFILFFFSFIFILYYFFELAEMGHHICLCLRRYKLNKLN